MQWYYVNAAKQQVGPLPDDEFNKLVQSGTVTAQTLVWHEGMKNWTDYGSASGAASVPSAIGTAAAPTGEGGQGACSQCGKTFPMDELVKYDANLICAACKPAFFQRLQEGAAVGRSPGGTGATPNHELAAQARTALAGHWWLAVGLLFLAGIISQIAASTFAPIVLIVAGPLYLGETLFFLAVARDEGPSIGMLFRGFSNFGPAFLLMLVTIVFVLLWSVLLVVPGIIAALSYSQAFFIMADDPSVGAMGALRKSKEMMRGMKWKLFCLGFRFIGWYLLCMVPILIAVMTAGFTLVRSIVTKSADMAGLAGGVGIALALIFVASVASLFVDAYLRTSMAAFYEDIRDRTAE